MAIKEAFSSPLEQNLTKQKSLRRNVLKPRAEQTLQTFLTSNTCGNSTDSGENLAKALIDNRLKEKEIENLSLKEQLAAVSGEKANLEKDLIAQSKTIAALSTEIARFNEQKVENEKLKQEIQQSADNFESLLKAAQDAREEMSLRLQSKIQDLNSEIEKIEREKSESFAESSALKTKLIESREAEEKYKSDLMKEKMKTSEQEQALKKMEEEKVS